MTKPTNSTTIANYISSLLGLSKLFDPQTAHMMRQSLDGAELASHTHLVGVGRREDGLRIRLSTGEEFDLVIERVLTSEPPSSDMRDYYAQMRYAYERLTPEQRSALEAWERENLDGTTATSDWPGWAELIGPSPRPSSAYPGDTTSE